MDYLNQAVSTKPGAVQVLTLIRHFMGPKEVVSQTGELFECLLEAHLNLVHPLIKLSKAIDWQVIESTFAGHFVSARGRPALPQR